MQQPCYPHLKEKDYVQNFIETVIKVATNPELSIDRTLGLCYAHMHLDERIKAIHEYLESLYDGISESLDSVAELLKMHDEVPAASLKEYLSVM